MTEIYELKPRQYLTHDGNYRIKVCVVFTGHYFLGQVPTRGKPTVSAFEPFDRRTWKTRDEAQAELDKYAADFNLREAEA